MRRKISLHPRPARASSASSARRSCCPSRLRECGELRKTRSHSSRLRVGRGEKVSRGLVWLAWITGEVIPNAIKIDTFPARDQPFRVRSVKVEMPDTRALQYFAPWIDSRNRRVHYDQPFYFIRIHCGVCISHHVSDVVRNHRRAVIPQRSHDSPDVLGLSLFVVTGFWLRRVSNPPEIGNDHRVVFHQVRGKRPPRIAVLRISVHKNNNGTVSPRTYENVRALRTVNRRGTEGCRQRW